jgi:DNA-binding XRE family transcriptional regulator
MISKSVLIPAQIRAGRALVGVSQQELAKHAEVSLTSLREIEGQRRAPDTVAAEKIRRALLNLGVVFIPSSVETGPGVCLADKRPNIVRPPTTVLFWEGVPFSVEWEGKEVIVFVSREAIDDLGRHREKQSDEVYLATFEKHRGDILDGVAHAIVNPENFDSHGRLHVRIKDMPALA